MIDFLNSIFVFLQDLAGSFQTAYQYASDGVDTLMDGSAVFPSIWSVLPAQLTAAGIGILAVGSFAALLLRVILR